MVGQGEGMLWHRIATLWLCGGPQSHGYARDGGGFAKQRFGYGWHRVARVMLSFGLGWVSDGIA